MTASTPTPRTPTLATAARERLATYGAESLGDVELLALASGAPAAAVLAAHEAHGGIGGLARTDAHASCVWEKRDAEEEAFGRAVAAAGKGVGEP